jgi:hypothetical protein
MIDVVAGRDKPWGGSLGGASLELPLSRQCPHRAGMTPCTRPPTQNPACSFPAPGSPDRTHGQTSSDSRMTGVRVRKLEPGTSLEVAPEQPVPLAASAQYPDPLQLYLVSYRVESQLAVVQSEVLVEATQHRHQLTLLVAALPVPMRGEPFLRTRQKLATTFPAWQTNHCKFPVAIRSAYVRETQEIECLGSLVVFRLAVSGEASEEKHPGFIIRQCQGKPREPSSQITVEFFRVPLVLETHHKIVSEPHQISLSLKPSPHLFLEPQIEHKVQIHVGQERAERTTLRRSRFHSDDYAVLQDASPEPFSNQPQDHSVRNTVRHHSHQPLMINVVKVSADVGLVEMPHFLGDQCGSQGAQRLMRVASRSKSIRAVQEVRLEHCFKDSRDRTLYQSIFDRGDDDFIMHSPPITLGI